MSSVCVEESLQFPVVCQNVRKKFGASEVLCDVSLSIPKGAVLGLIGRNGAGKTTLIRILVGLLMPEAGTACVLGEPVWGAACLRAGCDARRPVCVGVFTTRECA
jgi:ABC-type multidrug transport system ATPase subunit